MDAKSWLTVYAPNSVALGAASLDAVETSLSILLLGITIAWTTIKLAKLLKDKK